MPGSYRPKGKGGGGQYHKQYQVIIQRKKLLGSIGMWWQASKTTIMPSLPSNSVKVRFINWNEGLSKGSWGQKVIESRRVQTSSNNQQPLTYNWPIFLIPINILMTVKPQEYENHLKKLTNYFYPKVWDFYSCFTLYHQFSFLIFAHVSIFVNRSMEISILLYIWNTNYGLSII